MVCTAGDAAGVVEGHDLEAGVHGHREVREVLGILLLEKLQNFRGFMLHQVSGLKNCKISGVSCYSRSQGSRNPTWGASTLSATAQKAMTNRAKVNYWILSQETRQKSAIVSGPCSDIRGGTCPVVFRVGVVPFHLEAERRTILKTLLLRIAACFPYTMYVGGGHTRQ